MRKVVLLSTVFIMVAFLSLQARVPGQKDTAHIQILSMFAEQEEEIGLIDSTSLGIGGDDVFVIPANSIYTIWNNVMSDPYRMPIDSIINQNDTISIALGSFTYPLLTHIRVNSEFGKRGRRFHNGIDLKVNIGDTIVSSMAGMVRIAKYSGAFGNLVVVRHHNGLETFYGHLSKILVKADQMVESGEVIGLGGNTGRSTGPHLHYEVRYLGKAINPRHLIDFDSTLDLKNDTLFLTTEFFKHVAKQPSATTTSTASANLKAGQGGIWTIKSGDTLSRIAQRTGTSISYLCNVNGISRNGTLRLGQKIKY